MATVTASKTTQETLSERINRSTKDVHEVSGKAIDWKLSLILTSRTCYCEAISLFWIVYREIERLYRKHEHDHKVLELLQPVAVIFRRAPKFEEDIYFMMPSPDEAKALLDRRCGQERSDKDNGNKSQLYDPPALQEYVDRLEASVAKNPVHLVAYLYTMYGAITGGGAAIQKMVQRTFGLKTKEGVQIFELDLKGTNFASGKEVWKELKRILDEDAVDHLSEEEIQLILQEAPTVFEGNNALVATVQKTRAFGKATMDCTRRVGVSLAVAVAIFAAIMYYVQHNS